MDRLLQCFALLRHAEIRRIEARNDGITLCIHAPSVVQHLPGNGSILELVLYHPARFALEPFDAKDAPVDDVEALSKMHLEILGVSIPQEGMPCVMVRVNRPASSVHGGSLRFEAFAFTMRNERGEEVSLDMLAEAAGVGAAQALGGSAMGDHQAKLKRVLDTDVAPLLLAHGFRRTGKLFLRTRGALLDWVELEKFRFNTALSLAFWFQISVFAGDGSLAEEPRLDRNQVLLRAFPAYSSRMGALWGNEQEMYTITEGTSARELGERVQDDFLRWILPFFQVLATPAELILFLKGENELSASKKYSFHIANVLARLGEREEARPYFLESVGDTEAIRRVARSLGVEL